MTRGSQMTDTVTEPSSQDLDAFRAKCVAFLDEQVALKRGPGFENQRAFQKASPRPGWPG
ncbi:MAG: hypothetical protein R2705_05540 [Ilumatobacteraceae bacterium]